MLSANSEMLLHMRDGGMDAGICYWHTMSDISCQGDRNHPLLHGTCNMCGVNRHWWGGVSACRCGCRANRMWRQSNTPGQKASGSSHDIRCRSS